jgi:hypothetical protein
MLVVKAIEEVMHSPVIPAGTRPDKENKVVMKTLRAPSASKLSNSHLVKRGYYLKVRKWGSCEANLLVIQ